MDYQSSHVTNELEEVATAPNNKAMQTRNAAKGAKEGETAKEMDTKAEQTIEITDDASSLQAYLFFFD